jgi:hypothetical protein
MNSMSGFVVSIVVVSVIVTGAYGQSCPLRSAAPATLTGVLAGRSVMVGTSPASVMFTSKLDRDDDGAPNAYHRGLNDEGPDPGLDHICVGGSVLEFAAGRLRDRYATGGSIGALGGIDPASGMGRSRMCKRDYIAIRDAGFPACGPGVLCMIWYGIAAEKRRCGFPSSFGGAGDLRCGAPILQTDSTGTPADNYLTTTALRRPNSPGDTRMQTDYVDASTIPYIVMPGGLRLPNGSAWAPGDLAVMVWHGRTVYAVIGDTGPDGKIGEASRAALAALQAGQVHAIAPADPATTLVFPGTAPRVMTTWPLTRTLIDTEGRKLVEQAGGRDALRTCPGLSGLN